MERGKTDDKRLIPVATTPYGKLPTGSPNKNACQSWQRAYCLEMRIDNDPESLLVDGRTDILQCPVCAHVIELEVALDG
jgi:hypothetical protein